MARTLIQMYRLKPPGEWIHVDREMIQGTAEHVARDFSVLKFWRLIESKTVCSGEPSSGLWRVMPQGVKFLKREKTLPRRVYTFNDKVVTWGKEITDIDRALGDDFDYDDLMRGA